MVFSLNGKTLSQKNIMLRRGIDNEALGHAFDEKLHLYGKMLAIILIPLTIPVMWLTNMGIKKIKKEHTYTTYDLGTASLEINCIISYSLLLILPLFFVLIHRLFPALPTEIFVNFGFLGLLVLFFLFFRRAYQIKWWTAILAVIVFTIGYIIAMELYRLMSFIVFV
jgi:hypothetical protein